MLQKREIYRKERHNTKRCCAFALGIGPLLPVLSTFFIPDFITAYVFKVLFFSRPKVYSYKTKTMHEKT
jgi:hypothetical protein